MDADKNIRTGSPKFTFECPEFNTVKEGLKKGEYRLLVDFDAHFEEI